MQRDRRSAPETTQIFCETIYARVGQRGAVADQQKALISNLWEEAKDHAEIDRKGKINPTLDTKVRYKVKRSTKAWSAEAHEAFLATARSTLTLAADLRPAGRGCHQGALV